jgi:TRAP-type C4-dicarboxylate transport system substrate-binding protein
MRGQRLWRIRTRAAAAIALSLTAYSATQQVASGGDDKAGGDADPVVLTMADTTSGLAFNAAVQRFVDQVEELSDGALQVDVSINWGDYAPGAEQQVVRDVAAGEADLAWVWTHAFDTLGVNAFRALNAPMLIDSYPLQQAVIASDIPREMLAGLDAVGVTGLAVLADGLHKPIAVDHPLLSPADYDGINFTTRRSTTMADAVLALGADTEVAIAGARTVGLQSGEIQGYEMHLLGVSVTEVNLQLAPYLTANVNLWANPAALIANTHVLAALTETQRGWMMQAAATATEQSTELVDHDAELLVELCGLGARFADASEADLAAMREAFEPVYATLERDAQTAEFIARIEELKATTDPGLALQIPDECTGPSPVAMPPVDDQAAATGDQSVLNGTYRWTLTEDDALTSSPDPLSPEDLATFPGIFTVTLDDGIWTMRHDDREGSWVDCEGHCTYTIADDSLTFSWNGVEFTFTFTVDDNGSLQLEPTESVGRGEVFVWTTNPWERIDGGDVDAPAQVSVDGTYRWTLTEEDGRTNGGPVLDEAALATFPWIFTVTLEDGIWTMRHVDGDEGSFVDCADCTYTIDGDTISFEQGGAHLDFTFTPDRSGNLQLEPFGPRVDPGGDFVMTTEPWERID